MGIGYFVTVGLFCLILDLSNHTITSTLQKLFSHKNFLGLKVLSTEKRISKMITIILHKQKNLHVDDANFNQCVERSRSALKRLIKIFIKKRREISVNSNRNFLTDPLCPISEKRMKILQALQFSVLSLVF